jgi:hypothetical protein
MTTGDVELGKLEQADPRAVWTHEALDFTPWLLANADRLSEALGIDLELEAAERAVDGYALDLVARDITNDAVLIVENQLAINVMNHPPSKTAQALSASGIFIPNNVGTREACSRACRGRRGRP